MRRTIQGDTSPIGRRGVFTTTHTPFSLLHSRFSTVEEGGSSPVIGPRCRIAWTRCPEAKLMVTTLVPRGSSPSNADVAETVKVAPWATRVVPAKGVSVKSSLNHTRASPCLKVGSRSRRARKSPHKAEHVRLRSLIRPRSVIKLEWKAILLSSCRSLSEHGVSCTRPASSVTARRARVMTSERPSTDWAMRSEDSSSSE